MLRKMLLALVVIACGATSLQAMPSPNRIMPQPPGPGWVRVWVPAEYRTVYERVWVGERVDRVQERVWVAASYDLREVVYMDEWGRRCVRQEYVEVSPGYWTYQWKSVVTPAHEETVARQEVIRNGYWKWVRTEVPPMPEPRPVYRAPGTVGVEGYGSGVTGEDLSKFSPLSEWPDKK